MNNALVMSCLGVMGKGMLGIFVVILAIMGVVAVLNKVTSDK